MHMNIFDFLNKHGIEYHNKKLIEQAFIHSSYVNEHKGNFGDSFELFFLIPLLASECFTKLYFCFLYETIF